VQLSGREGRDLIAKEIEGFAGGREDQVVRNGSGKRQEALEGEVIRPHHRQAAFEQEIEPVAGGGKGNHTWMR
jgi:hypothetical protein